MSCSEWRTSAAWIARRVHSGGTIVQNERSKIKTS